MAYPTNMVYVRWDFQWKNTTEIQAVGMWGVVTQEAAFPFQPWDLIVQAIADKAVESWADSWEKAKYAGSVQAMRAVAYHYDQPHLEVLDRAEAPFDGSNAWAGTSTTSMPPQLSVVASLYGYEPSSFVPQRARKRGRVYLPTPALGQLGGDGEMTAGTQGEWLTDATAWLNAMTGVLDIPGASPGDDTHWRPYVSSVAGAIATKVGYLRIGRRVDTQRRRANKLPETYLSGPINT